MVEGIFFLKLVFQHFQHLPETFKTLFGRKSRRAPSEVEFG